MKYALIGCGRIAKNHINAALKNSLEIVSICDINQQSMVDKNEYFELGLKERDLCFSDYKKMLDTVKPSLVAIATDSGSHAGIAIECINRGINVIIEKPIALNLEDAKRIIRISREKNVKVCVCHQNRFNPAVQKTHSALKEGKFGKISHATIHIRWNRDRAYYSQSAWRGTWKYDGGCLMNQCIHGIDLLRWMMGIEIDEVYGMIAQRFHQYLEVEDIGVGVVRFKNGAVATIEGTVNVYPKNFEEALLIFGSEGTVKIGGTSVNNIEVWEFSDTHFSENGNRGYKEEVSDVYGNGHYRLYKDMIGAISENRKPYVDAEAGYLALELVLAIYKSQITKMPVRFPLEEFSCMDMKEEL